MAYLIPVANKIIPDVDRRNTPLPPQGREVELVHQYWLRRIEDKDVKIGQPPIKSQAEVKI